MTKNKGFKKLVRERMAKTGEPYTTARQHLHSPTKPLANLNGWFVTGPGDGKPDFKLTDYAGGIDPDTTHQGKPCAVLHSTVEAPQSHAVIMQSINSVDFLGGRIRFSAWIRCEEDTTNADLWVRVVPINRDSATLSRGLFRATPTWQHGEVVVDVDPRSVSIMFGLSLTGRGRVWMSEASFEKVDLNTPVTQEGAVWREPNAPTNLDFMS